MSLPADLLNITFDDQFNQIMENVRLPTGIQRFTLVGELDQSMDNVSWRVTSKNSLLIMTLPSRKPPLSFKTRDYKLIFHYIDVQAALR